MFNGVTGALRTAFQKGTVLFFGERVKLETVMKEVKIHDLSLPVLYLTDSPDLVDMDGRIIVETLEEKWCE